jgi:DNA polymerase zeta
MYIKCTGMSTLIILILWIPSLVSCPLAIAPTPIPIMIPVLPVRQYITTMERSLNHAISVTLKQNPNSPTSRHIRAIVLVKGVPFYGFHSGYAPFLKIYLVDPSDLIRLTTLLSSGAIMGTAFKVYEAHLSFVLQFLSDFGLYGCNWLDLANSNPLRSPPKSPSSGSTPLATYPASKESALNLEFAVVPPEILNRRRITSPASQQNLDKDSSIFRSPDVQSLRELWDTERVRRMKLGLPPTPTPAIKFDASGNAEGQWNTTRMLWDRIYERIACERLSQPQVESPDDWMMWNMSTFESVQALWPSQFRTWYPTDENGDVLDATVNPYHQDTEAYLPHLPVDIKQAILEAEIFDDLLKQHGESQESPEDSRSMDRDGAPYDCNFCSHSDSAEDGRDIFQVEDEPIPNQIPEEVPVDEECVVGLQGLPSPNSSSP